MCVVLGVKRQVYHCDQRGGEGGQEEGLELLRGDLKNTPLKIPISTISPLPLITLLTTLTIYSLYIISGEWR